MSLLNSRVAASLIVLHHQSATDSILVQLVNSNRIQLSPIGFNQRRIQPLGQEYRFRYRLGAQATLYNLLEPRFERGRIG